MKKLVKMLTAVLLVTLIALPLFAGGKQEKQTAPASVETASKKEVQIRIMGYGGQDPAVVVRLLDEVIGEGLEKEGIKLSYEPLEGDYNAALFNALSAGTAADIFYIPVETAPGIIATGKVLPLNGLVDTSPFIDSLVEAYTFNGKIYGIAKDFNTLALHYNKDLFDKAGVAYPDENDNWDTLREKIGKLAGIGDNIYGISLPADYARFGAFAFAAGWKPFDEKGNTNLLDPKFKTAVEYYTGMVREGIAVQPSDLGQGWTGGAFATEQVGIAVEGAWILGFLRNEAPNIQYGTTFMPVGPSGERGNFLYTVAYGINTDSPNREAAVKVLEALTSEEAQQFVLEQGLAIPSRKALVDNPFLKKGTPEAEANRVVFEGSRMGFVYGYQFGKVGTDWFRPINSALATIMTGEKDIDTALKQAQSEIEALIERAK
ncbi:MAG: ABC transporter substrate-binding protein [Spirochaetes bacterium]|nr:MAG: ABC transporter substrate-binding protein [Spirochaetota bacterium]